MNLQGDFYQNQAGADVESRRLFFKKDQFLHRKSHWNRGFFNAFIWFCGIKNYIKEMGYNMI